MSFFKKIMGGDEEKNSHQPTAESRSEHPAIRFGRYTDMNKSPEQIRHWDDSMNAYKEKNYMNCFRSFIQYIADPGEQNVSWREEGSVMKFEIVQGSKIVKGHASAEEFAAESFIATFDTPGVAVMRKLMSLNYSLKYSWYAIKDNALCMKFTTAAGSASPYKLYDALKELSTSVDKQDDILLDEFDSLRPVDNPAMIEVPEAEKEIKLKYFYRWLDETFEKVSKLDEEKFSGAISYLWLSLAYKSDFLLSPEGVLTNSLERVHSLYFQKFPEGQHPGYISLNRKIEDEYKKLREMPREEIYKSFYRTKATFTILVPANFKQIADYVFNESKNTEYYYNNRMDDMVQTIYQHIAGYCLFIYGLYVPIKKLLQLYLHITNNDFFTELGFPQQFYNPATKALNGQAISNEINVIIADGKKEFPALGYNLNNLRYDSLTEFSVSFFKEFDFLNFTK